MPRKTLIENKIYNRQKGLEMHLEPFIEIYYTFIHIAPFDFLIFYVFRHHLRFSPLRTAGGYSVLLLIEAALQLHHPGIYDQHLSMLLQLMYLTYDLWAIQETIPRILSIGLLTVPLELIAYSTANLTEQSFFIFSPGFTSCLTITAVYLVFFRPAISYIHRVLEPLVEIREATAWRYLFAYETMLIYIALLIDPFHTSTELRVFASRILLLIADVACIHIMAALCRSIESREYTSYLLNSLRSLQEMERHHFESVEALWRASRKIRHDFRHHIAAIANLARMHDDKGLRLYLEKLASGVFRQN